MGEIGLQCFFSEYQSFKVKSLLFSFFERKDEIFESFDSFSAFFKNYIRKVLFFLKCLKEFIDKLCGFGIFFGERFLKIVS